MMLPNLSIYMFPSIKFLNSNDTWMTYETVFCSLVLKEHFGIELKQKHIMVRLISYPRDCLGYLLLHHKSVQNLVAWNNNSHL